MGELGALARTLLSVELEPMEMHRVVEASSLSWGHDDEIGTA